MKKLLIKYSCLILLTILIIQPAICMLHSSTNKSLFVNKCCACHNDVKASRISPSLSSARQWKRFFQRDKHKRKYKDISEYISSEESDAILSYLIEHAADSLKPQAFGLR